MTTSLLKTHIDRILSQLDILEAEQAQLRARYLIETQQKPSPSRQDDQDAALSAQDVSLDIHNTNMALRASESEITEYNPNHDPSNGEFSSGGDGGSIGKQQFIKRGQFALAKSDGSRSFDSTSWQVKSEDGRHASLMKQYGPVYNKLSSQDRAAVKEYSGDGFKDLNKQLRSDKPLDEHQKTMVDSLDRVLASSKTTQDITLTRGIGNGTALKAALASGGLLRDNAYTSTTIKDDPGLRFTGMKGITATIRYPKGSPGMYIGDNGPLADEREFLIPRGAVYRVISYDPEERTAELEYLPHTSASNRMRKS